MGEILPASPHRRTQPSSSPSPFNRKITNSPSQSRDSSSTIVDLGWRALLRRHQFLLFTLAILTFLCTVYLYFAVTLGNVSEISCDGLTGTHKAVCEQRHRGIRKILQLQMNADEQLLKLVEEGKSTVAVCSRDPADSQLRCKVGGKSWSSIPSAAFSLIHCTLCHDVDVGELQRILEPGGLVAATLGSITSGSLRKSNWTLERTGRLEVWRSPEDHFART